MNIETLLQEASTYFKGKILKKEYKIKEIREYIICLVVDEKYEFQFWTTSSTSFGFRYGHVALSFSKDEENQLTQPLFPFVEEHRKQLRDEEHQEYMRLKKKFEPQ